MLLLWVAPSQEDSTLASPNRPPSIPSICQVTLPLAWPSGPPPPPPPLWNYLGSSLALCWITRAASSTQPSLPQPLALYYHLCFLEPSTSLAEPLPHHLGCAWALLLSPQQGPGPPNILESGPHTKDPLIRTTLGWHPTHLSPWSHHFSGQQYPLPHICFR